MINGTVIIDTLHLTSEDSPVLVNGVLDISLGGTLVVDAGTTLIFETPSSGINVNAGGQLLIAGAIDNRVVLKPFGDQEFWSGIVFGAGSVGATFVNKSYLSGSAIQYTDIVRAGYSSGYAFTIGMSLQEGVVPYILGVDMLSCAGRYVGRVLDIQNLQTIAVIRNLRIIQSNDTQTDEIPTGYGMHVYGNGDNAGHLYLENLQVDVHLYYEALSVSSIEQVSVMKSSFLHRVGIRSIGDAVIQGSTMLSSLSLSDIKKFDVSKNSVMGLDINSRHWSESIDFSSVVDNLITGQLSLNGYSRSNITISDNIIRQSTTSGMHIYNRRGWLKISNNTISDCSTTYHPVIELISDTSSDELSFMNNSIIDSYGVYLIDLQGSASSYLFLDNKVERSSALVSLIFLRTNYPWVTVSRNIFDNNTAPHSVVVDVPSFEEMSIALPLNYWGNFQSDVIGLRASVVDGFVSVSQPIVDFVSVLSGPSVER